MSIREDIDAAASRVEDAFVVADEAETAWLNCDVDDRDELRMAHNRARLELLDALVVHYGLIATRSVAA